MFDCLCDNACLIFIMLLYFSVIYAFFFFVLLTESLTSSVRDLEDCGVKIFLFIIIKLDFFFSLDSFSFQAKRIEVSRCKVYGFNTYIFIGLY